MSQNCGYNHLTDKQLQEHVSIAAAELALIFQDMFHSKLNESLANEMGKMAIAFGIESVKCAIDNKVNLNRLTAAMVIQGMG